jgi:hypothetical protein
MVKQRKIQVLSPGFIRWESFIYERMSFTSAVTLAEAYTATIVAAILAGITLLAGMLFGTLIRRLRNVHFTLQPGNCYKGHGWSPTEVMEITHNVA